jgi:hypothetical protein
MAGMKHLKNIAIPLAVLASLYWGWRTFEWLGVLGVLGAVVMWALLHFTRTMQVLRRASRRPVGHVDSAVMLNARLQAGMSLLHVLAMTRALGQAITPAGVDPEAFAWTDASNAAVRCEFRGGQLTQWTLSRPQPDEPGAPKAESANAGVDRS